VYANVRKQILFSFFCSSSFRGFSIPVTKDKDVKEAKTLTQRLFPNDKILRFDFVRESKPIAAGGSKDRCYFTCSDSNIGKRDLEAALNLFFYRQKLNSLPLSKTIKELVDNWECGYYDDET